MVNIRKLIEGTKDKFRAAKNSHLQQQSVKQAQDLQKMREDRILLEGKANLDRLQAQERARIAAAKGPNAVQKLGTGLAAVMNRLPKNSNSKKSGNGLSFLGKINQGSHGVSPKVPQGLEFGSGSPFGSIPKVNPPQKKAKSIHITIR